MERCRRCGRQLKDKQSIKLGYGPVCYEKMEVIKDKPKLFRPLTLQSGKIYYIINRGDD